MKTFKEFYYQSVEIIESSVSQSEKRRGLASRGPATGIKGREQARLSSSRAALQKAGFRQLHSASGYGAKMHSVSSSPEHRTKIRTYNNPTEYATRTFKPKFNLRIQQNDEPTSFKQRLKDRKLALRSLRKQIGPMRTPRPVHDVEIDTKVDRLPKNDPHRAFARAKSFGTETKSIEKSLKSAGAKPGSTTTGEPVSMMGGEDEKQGAQKRERLYRNLGTFGKNARVNPNTGLMVGKVI